MKKWTLCYKKKIPLSLFAYTSRDGNSSLLWGAACVENIRTFESRKDALKWLDKKWLKYGDKVNQWRPVELEKLIARNKT